MASTTKVDSLMYIEMFSHVLYIMEREGDIRGKGREGGRRKVNGEEKGEWRGERRGDKRERRKEGEEKEANNH
jgi:hypothetical protein